jgi:hypothetical protein
MGVTAGWGAISVFSLHNIETIFPFLSNNINTINYVCLFTNEQWLHCCHNSVAPPFITAQNMRGCQSPKPLLQKSHQTATAGRQKKMLLDIYREIWEHASGIDSRGW